MVAKLAWRPCPFLVLCMAGPSEESETVRKEGDNSLERLLQGHFDSRHLLCIQGNIRNYPVLLLIRVHVGRVIVAVAGQFQTWSRMPGWPVIVSPFIQVKLDFSRIMTATTTDRLCQCSSRRLCYTEIRSACCYCRSSTSPDSRPVLLYSAALASHIQYHF